MSETPEEPDGAGGPQTDSNPRSGPDHFAYFKLPESLKGAGYAPEQITDIIVTHVHPDHTGGLTVGGKKVFPNAIVHMAGEKAPARAAGGACGASSAAVRTASLHGAIPARTLPAGTSVLPLR